jgi:hypothetical protein
MKVNPNASNEEVRKEASVDLYAGLATVSVVAINPTKAELHKLGMTYVEKEPSYVLEPKAEGDPIKYRMSFQLKAAVADNPGLDKDVFFQYSTIVAPVQGTSKKGDYLFINERGKTCYAPSIGSLPEWFKHKEVNPAFSGENMLLEFIRVWANVGNDEMCMFDNRAAVSQGKVSEIDKLIPMLKDNRFVILLGINNYNGKHYSEVYSKYFGNTYTTLGTWQQKLAGDYGKFNAVYPPTLALRKMTFEEYSEPNVTAAPGTAPFMKPDSSSNPFAKGTAAPEPALTKEEDEFLNGPAPDITVQAPKKKPAVESNESKLAGHINEEHYPTDTEDVGNPFFTDED